MDLIITLVKITFVVSILITTTMSEEKKTKECPYCGEEILATAKKCKHCGEWLEEHKENPLLSDEEIDQIAEDAVNEVMAKQEKIENVAKIAATVVGAIAVLLVLFFTVPSEQKHIGKLDEVLNEYANQVIRDLKNTAAENITGLHRVSDFVTPEICKAVRETSKQVFKEKFKYNNILLYSTGEIDGEITQLGVLGIVFDFMSIKPEETQEDATYVWNMIVNAFNEGISPDELAEMIIEEVEAKSTNQVGSENNGSSVNTNMVMYSSLSLSGNIKDSDVKVTFQLSIDDDLSVNGTVKYDYSWGYTRSSTVGGTVRVVPNTSNMTIELEDEDGGNYTFRPFPSDLNTDKIIADYAGIQDGWTIVFLKQ